MSQHWNPSVTTFLLEKKHIDEREEREEQRDAQHFDKMDGNGHGSNGVELQERVRKKIFEQKEHMSTL